MEKLFEKFANDDAFARKYAKLSSLDDVLKQAREDGYSVTAEEAKAYIADHSGELSEGNLSSVAGGLPGGYDSKIEIETSRQRLRKGGSCASWIC
jgi:predicted ribosomally synthesized peptide with nif11-like leader